MFTDKHILQVEVMPNISTDELGRPISSPDKVWIDVCKCRCDDNSTEYFQSDNGSVYRPNYHILCEGHVDIQAGAHIRCLNDDGSVRGEGQVYKPKRFNFLPYTELWA